MSPCLAECGRHELGDLVELLGGKVGTRQAWPGI